MQQLTKQISLIERIDQLIRLRATGTPTALAARLGVSKATLYRVLDVMKELNAPIVYNLGAQCFEYEEAVRFKCGFYVKAMPDQDALRINGGTIVMGSTLASLFQQYCIRC